MAENAEQLAGRLRNSLQQEKQNAEASLREGIDRSTEQSVKAAQQAMAEAQAEYAKRMTQINAGEAQAKDNSVLYSEARGDRGGTGRVQYDSIANRAQNERAEVNTAREKLSRDTAERIADLRAEGEYKKAEQLQQLGQEYLGKLGELEKWAYSAGANEAQRAEKQAQWEQEYALKQQQYALDNANTAGRNADGEESLAARKARREQLAAAGEALLQYGISPNAEQLAAMGWTAEQLAAYMALNKK